MLLYAMHVIATHNIWYCIKLHYKYVEKTVLPARISANNHLYRLPLASLLQARYLLPSAPDPGDAKGSQTDGVLTFDHEGDHHLAYNFQKI